MEIKYWGTLPDGYVIDPETNINYSFKARIPIDVPDGFGERLLAKSPTIWKRSSKERSKKEEAK